MHTWRVTKMTSLVDRLFISAYLHSLCCKLWIPMADYQLWSIRRWIMKQIRYLYARDNTMQLFVIFHLLHWAQSPRHAYSDCVVIRAIAANCRSQYVAIYSCRKLRVASNDVLDSSCGSRECVMSFCGQQCLSFWFSLRSCDNVLVQTASCCDLYTVTIVGNDLKASDLKSWF